MIMFTGFFHRLDFRGAERQHKEEGIKPLQDVKPFPAPHNGRDSEVIQATAPLLEGIYLNELSAQEGCERLQEAIQAILDMPPVEAA